MNGGSKLKTVTNNGLLASKALLGRKAGRVFNEAVRSHTRARKTWMEGWP
jgi:hypothetical protein